jgi:hypothetical protein
MENRQNQVSQPPPSDPEPIPGKQGFSWWEYLHLSSWLSPRSHVAQTSGTTTVSSISNHSGSPPSASLPSDPLALAQIQWNDIDQGFLDSVLMNKEGFKAVSKLKGENAAVIVDLLDKVASNFI